MKHDRHSPITRLSTLSFVSVGAVTSLMAYAWAAPHAPLSANTWSVDAFQTPSAGMLKIPDAITHIQAMGRGFEGEHLRVHFNYSVGGTGVQIVRRERPSTAEDWVTLKRSEGTSYFVTGATSRLGGGELYLTGVQNDGAAILERWVFPERHRGFAVDASPLPAAPTLGSPLGPVVHSSHVVGGGPWQAPRAGGSDLMASQRTVLFTTVTGPLHGLAVDPQGRYAISHDMAVGALMRFDLTATPVTWEVMATASTHPSLDQVGSIQLMDYPDEGRVLLVRRQYAENFHSNQELYTLFRDADNDGVFDPTPTVLDHAGWLGSPYSDWDQWQPFWKENP